MIIDALVAHHTDGRQHFDHNGHLARTGEIHARMLDSMLRDPCFDLAPPKIVRYLNSMAGNLSAASCRSPLYRICP